MIAGTGIGSGVMAIPFLFKNAGMVGGIIAFIFAFIVTIFMHYIVADIVINSPTYAITTILNKLLLSGKFKKLYSAIIFVSIIVMFMANLSTYILGGAEMMSSLFGIHPDIAKLMFWIVATLVVLLGLKVIGIGEKYLVITIICLVIYFFIVSIMNRNGSINFFGGFKSSISMFSMLMFSMTALFAVPVIVKGQNRDVVKIKKSIKLGLSINVLVSALICYSVINSSYVVTEMAAVGWSNSLGPVMRILSAVFILLAMMTSFLVLSFSFSDIICTHFRINFRVSNIIATLPSLLIAFIPVVSFIDLAKVTSGVISILMSILLIPAYRCSVKLTGCSPLLGSVGESKLFFCGIIVGNLIMAIGAVW